MKNKYLFDENKETLLINTELDIAEVKKIPVMQCQNVMKLWKKEKKMNQIIWSV
jgi:hypothetical protein